MFQRVPVFVREEKKDFVLSILEQFERVRIDNIN